MLKRIDLIDALMEKFDDGTKKPADIQAERARLHGMRLDLLGEHYGKTFPGMDPHTMKPAA